ncbi:DUF3261 domain-containing protein [Dongshaea marina]|uniref:DUF3261 domain-containing protein n=1 Tax=Dongshaea marina TaxID=2047966 RepID=UPI000D3ECD4A|nr:DUF3261 domain-containing protein [Dongshaea marina]
MRKNRILLICGLLLALTACSSIRQQAPSRVTLAKDHPFTLPQPNSYPQKITATQLVSGKYKQQTHSLQFQVEQSPERLVLVGISPWGGELFSANWDGKEIKTSSLPAVSKQLQPLYMLADFIITYYPAKVLSPLLARGGMTLQDTPLTRSVLVDGKPLIQINYQYPDHWRGKITYRHIQRHYSLTIETIQAQH